MPDDVQKTTNGPGGAAQGNDQPNDIKQALVEAKRLDDTLKSAGTGTDSSAASVQLLQMLFARSVDFSRSGVFFILLGCGFLYTAYRVLYHVHPTFVFILALLGMSIVLFGTGTQSLGTGEFTDTKSQFKFKGYLAGGAGALAGIFGFGAVLGAPQIERVFSTSDGYALVVFDVTNAPGSHLRQATVDTYLTDGRSLPFVIRDASIEALAPISRGYEKLQICINVTGPDKKWNIERSCPILQLKDNEPGQRPEPVQSVAEAALDIKFNTIVLDDRGDLAAPPPAFKAQ